MSMFGKMSVGIEKKMTYTPKMATSIAATTNVYGRRRARRTIHMGQTAFAKQDETKTNQRMMNSPDALTGAGEDTAGRIGVFVPAAAEAGGEYVVERFHRAEQTATVAVGEQVQLLR